MDDSIQVGSLVIDSNPYKAPEVLFGYGLVIGIVDEKYVTVHWIKSDFIQNVRIEEVSIANEK